MLNYSDIKHLESLLNFFEDPQPFIQSLHGERILTGQWFFERDDFMTNELTSVPGQDYIIFRRCP